MKAWFLCVGFLFLDQFDQKKPFGICFMKHDLDSFVSNRPIRAITSFKKTTFVTSWWHTWQRDISDFVFFKFDAKKLNWKYLLNILNIFCIQLSKFLLLYLFGFISMKQKLPGTLWNYFILFFCTTFVQCTFGAL
jgi:hypothetical protein